MTITPLSSNRALELRAQLSQPDPKRGLGKVGHVCLQILSQIVPDAVTSLALLSSKGRKEDARRLSQIAQGEELQGVIYCISPKLAKMIRDEVWEDDHIELPQRLLEKLFDILIPRLVLNTYMHAQKHPGHDSVLADVAANLTEIVDAHLNLIAEGLSRPNITKQEICALFAPMAEHLLHIFFPRNSRDLPLQYGLHLVVWYKLKKELPEALAKLYLYFNSIHLKKAEAWYARGFYALSAQGSGWIAKQVANVLPSMLHQDSMVAKKIAKGILDSLATRLSEEQKHQLDWWIKLQLEAMGRDARLTKFWHFIANYLVHYIPHLKD